MWSVNDRVLARPEERDDWFPGTVRHVKGQRYYVILDSGEDGWFVDARLRPLEIARETPAARRRWNVGDRVFARWGGDLLWYPGTVFSHREGGYAIVYDDQDQSVVTANDLMPLVVHEGDRVLCRPKFERELRYFPAEITRVDGEIIDVVYDDFELVEHNTNVSRIRVRGSTESPISWQEGERVLASGRDGFWYPAIILVVDGGRLFAGFFDGRHAWALPEEVQPLRFKPSTAVHVRKAAGLEYNAAIVSEVRENVLRVRYDDGTEETTLVRLVRVPQPAH